MEHQAPQPDCIIKIEGVGCCENCAKRVRRKIVRLEGVHSVEIDRERRWVYIAGDVEPQLLMDYLTQRTVKPDSVKLLYYCSKEARSHAKNQTPMENKSESHVMETYCHRKINMASDHANNSIPNVNHDKRGGENYNQDSSHHHHTRSYFDPNHYAPCKDWVHRPENYVAQAQNQDQYASCECRNPSCDFHAWKRRGSSSFDFDMRSAGVQWLREVPPLFYGPHEPIKRPPGHFPYMM